MIDLASLAEDLAPDGSLRDVYVFGTSLTDWDRALTFAASCDATIEYSVDGEVQSNLPTAATALGLRRDASPLLRVCLGGVTFACHFFTPDEIEFDFVPNEIDRPERLQALLQFVEGLGRSTGKVVVVTHENSPKLTFLRYDPRRSGVEHVHE
jgi:hypothetical protein